MVEIEPTKMLITWGWCRWQPGFTPPAPHLSGQVEERPTGPQRLRIFAGRWHPEMEGLSI